MRIYVLTRGLRTHASWCPQATAVVRTKEEEARVRDAGIFREVIRSDRPLDCHTKGAAVQAEFVRQINTDDRYVIVQDNVFNVFGGFGPAVAGMMWLMDRTDARLVSLSTKRFGNYAFSHSMMRLKVFMARADLPPWEIEYAEDQEMQLRLMAGGELTPRYMAAGAWVDSWKPETGAGTWEDRKRAVFTRVMPMLADRYRHIANITPCFKMALDWHKLGAHSILVPPPPGLKYAEFSNKPWPMPRMPGEQANGRHHRDRGREHRHDGAQNPA